MSQQPPEPEGPRPTHDPPPQGAPGYPPGEHPTGRPAPPGGPGSQQERNWAMLCHIASFAGFIVPIAGSIVGPLAVWLLKRDEFPLVDDQGKEALNFQLSLLLYGLIAFVLVFVLIGFLLLALIAVFDVVMVVVAAIQASQGKAYRYPLCIRFVR
ncbi:MAG: DUF4870 domain-containing protein [Actinomycetota bacterium]